MCDRARTLSKTHDGFARLFSVDRGTGPGKWAAGNTGYYSTIAPQAPSAMAAHAPLMIDVLASIEQRISQAELGSESLQQAFAVSRASLYRLFQSRPGVASYIRQQRLSTAHRYLQAYPDCRLTWLLYAMGFASERQVQRAFQQRFGMPPMQWRHQCHAASRRTHPRHDVVTTCRCAASCAN